MKKLLLVLLVVTLASFLFVGCLPAVTPDDGEDEDEVEVEGACPTVSVTTEVEIGGKKYIKGALNTVTVTFAEATEQVSVWVGAAIKDNPVGVPSAAVEMVMYPDADKKVYTGTYRFTGGVAGSDCDEDYIYVVTCATCAPCKFPYVVDDLGPCSEILIREYPLTGCACGGVNINFVTQTASCITCCGDECAGLDTATFDLYKTNPFGVCCDIPCIAPIATCTSVGCDIDCTISCFNIYDHYTYATTALHDAASETFYLVATLADLVGNKTYYYATVVMDSGAIGTVTEYVDGQAAGSCTGWTSAELAVAGTADVIGACADSDGVCATVSAQ
jgi:hypothetical protein